MPEGASGTRSLPIGSIALWIVRVALAAEFLYSGYLLFAGGHTEQTFAEIGLGQWLRYVTGVLEVGGAVGLLIPRLGGPAALLLAGVMVGASVTELFILTGGGPVLPLILLIACATLAWFRQDQTRALLGIEPPLDDDEHC
ncbi:DoxX family protein [Amycolatopsis regifaucium]|uniref:DoxX family protein n=1 Tax=Amycolatopsis regifaucium TaxID=546365 RepID=A0A154MS12_9PSEU|nr:DoxX family protein [Amycolatopsis regifaucium]KZB86890.1 DoxX family protein [Amycolatopsis regifaucium]OKA09320.1 DoxX family protein [Amycolatopsis regifaucium]SFH58378.1 DoxX-like family protein [Amycolatopsis regifaucium]